MKKNFNMKNEIEEEKKVLIIDVSNLLYRCYYTFKHLKNKKGESTGAIYGFLNMLIFYKEKTNIENMILVWDTASEHSWRLDIFKEYKINRRIGTRGDPKNIPIVIKDIKNKINKTKDPLIKKILNKQLEKINTMRDIVFAKANVFNICKATGFISVVKEKYEADDLVSMIVRKLKRNVKILSMDKDLLQLVNDKDKVRVFRPDFKQKDKSYVIYNEKKTKEEFGVLPKDLSILLAIAGDDCDGVPGIKGFGYKKAVKLFEENNGDIEKALSEEDYKIYERNLALVNLSFIPGEIKREDFIIKKKNIEVAKEILDQLEIKKFTAENLAFTKNSFRNEIRERFK